mmetsp:Transcript_31710/g.82076  ORF Transcript_31710/g.82076 Transcript_31710/m.82076 type:complete len:220 (+) Transcript_31710:1288-1947(+)
MPPVLDPRIPLRAQEVHLREDAPADGILRASKGTLERVALGGDLVAVALLQAGAQALVVQRDAVGHLRWVAVPQRGAAVDVGRHECHHIALPRGPIDPGGALAFEAVHQHACSHKHNASGHNAQDGGERQRRVVTRQDAHGFHGVKEDGRVARRDARVAVSEAVCGPCRALVHAGALRAHRLQLQAQAVRRHSAVRRLKVESHWHRSVHLHGQLIGAPA